MYLLDKWIKFSCIWLVLNYSLFKGFYLWAMAGSNIKQGKSVSLAHGEYGILPALCNVLKVS